MPIHVERPDSDALVRRLTELQASARPGSRALTSARKDLRTLVVEDHADMLTRGVDRYGKDRAPLAPRTLADPRRGPGPSLIPRGLMSRFVTNFEALWETRGGVMLLVARYADILSKQGVPFVKFHMTGTRSMPRRDTGGITPKGWRGVIARFAQVPADIQKGGG